MNATFACWVEKNIVRPLEAVLHQTSELPFAVRQQAYSGYGLAHDLRTCLKQLRCGCLLMFADSVKTSSSASSRLQLCHKMLERMSQHRFVCVVIWV